MNNSSNVVIVGKITKPLEIKEPTETRKSAIWHSSYT
jgi:hypothetical protein